MFSFVLLIPHFTGIFPKNTWGQVLTIQAFALWLQIVIEYGFNLSATRGMARVRDDESALSHLVAGVTGAKAFLSLIVIVIALMASIEMNILRGLGQLLFLATIYAVLQGYNPVWYFLARGKFSQYAVIEFVNRLTYLILCLFFIRNSSQSSLIFTFGIITALFTNFSGYMLMSRQIKIRFPTILDSWHALKEGFGMFLFVGVTSVYTTLNLVILGFSQTTGVVAAYGTSDRIVRATGGLLDPLNRIVYAKISFLYHHDFDSALNFLKRASFVISGAGVFIFIIGQLSAGLIVRILAPGYPESVFYLRLLFWFIPLLAINNIVGLHVMLPLGMDKIFNAIFMTVSVLSVGAMLLFVPAGGAGAMALITIFTEAAACVGMIVAVWRGGRLNASLVNGRSHA
ncbi:hypothetical protein Q0M94_08065 [Deinococcus radiomollis]|uniref:oligosaccharide flippase family protein n=1 Tax=Deinococcus radiomollis TaxID=468916 RepID=UPI003891F8C2